MADSDYGRANVALYDPVHVNLRTTRYALQQLGFRNITSLSAFKELKRAVQEDAPHLLIAEPPTMRPMCSAWFAPSAQRAIQ
jgi:hypothetical protein